MLVIGLTWRQLTCQLLLQNMSVSCCYFRLQRLQLDALWSDPNAAVTGVAYNPRGVAILFGPDVARRFLERTGLKMIVRSHECVQEGFELAYKGENRHLVATIFSASDYGGGNNSGAYIQFTTECKESESSKYVAVPGCNLWYSVHNFTVDPLANLSLKKPKSEKLDKSMGIVETIKFNQTKLLDAFNVADSEGKGEVSKLAWADIMQRTTGLKIRWLTMIPFIVPEEFRASGEIDYKAFIRFICDNDFGA